MKFRGVMARNIGYCKVEVTMLLAAGDSSLCLGCVCVFEMLDREGVS